LARLYQEVKAVNPNLVVSMAPNIYDWGLKEYLQDLPTWLNRGLVDLVHPQIYRRDFQTYKSVVNKNVVQQFPTAQLRKFAPGALMKLGSYRISPEYLLQAIEYNRACGIPGEAFFFYEGLRDNDNELARLLRDGPYAQPALFPSVSDLNQGSVSNNRSSTNRGFGRLLAFWQNLF
jgi:uncharacterized lipoprotein YddW (UPF0748 family)